MTRPTKRKCQSPYRISAMLIRQRSGSSQLTYTNKFPTHGYMETRY
jgi:hypothetical protein